MAKPIVVTELLSLEEYEKVRLDMRKRVVALKKVRRVPVGNRISFVFESRDTVFFQLHETMRAEGITDKAALQAECDVYNAMLPNSSVLSACLVIDLPEGINVRHELQRLAGMEKRIALVVGPEAIPAVLEPVSGTEGIAPNQHVRFPLSPTAQKGFAEPTTPVLLQIDHPSYDARTPIEGETRRSLIEDLS
ncbi:MAG: DUF3501 family protein [Deltaproteobacteria bacterium]|nr:DUF3501 family protein [Deltaproteobacteria bacterium]